MGCKKPGYEVVLFGPDPDMRAEAGPLADYEPRYTGFDDFQDNSPSSVDRGQGLFDVQGLAVSLMRAGSDDRKE